jgi:hypothetical protein
MTRNVHAFALGDGADFEAVHVGVGVNPEAVWLPCRDWILVGLALVRSELTIDDEVAFLAEDGDGTVAQAQRLHLA